MVDVPGYAILDKLTSGARRIMAQSRAAARGGFVTPRNFLALLSREGGVVAEILRGVNEGWEWKEGRVGLLELLEAAYDEARHLGHPYVGAEHLFLGLVRLGSPENLDKARRRVAQVVSFPKGVLSKDLDSTPLLDAFGTDLTSLARKGSLDPVVGREDVLSRVVRILLRKERNSPILIGEAGVGKTAIVRGLAVRISRSQVPFPLLKKRIVRLDFPRFLASLSHRGDVEAGFSSLLAEVQVAGDIILFVDEFHTLMGGGSVVGVSSGVVNVLKEALASGGIQFLGATNPDEYRRHLEFDQTLVGRLVPVPVREPTMAEAEEILKALAPKFERFHRVKYSPGAIHQAVALSKRYFRDRFLPGNALDILDESGARVRAEREELPPEFQKILRGLRDVSRKLFQALENRDLDEAVRLRSQRKLLQRRLESFSSRRERTQVDEEVVALVVAERTGIPLAKLQESEGKKFKDIEKALGARVVGQDHAVCVLARALRRSRVGLADPRRPIGSFLFLGPTGVGKTELARALADFLFGSSQRLIRFDMSEFRERHTMARLIGAPPGYVGYGQGGELTEGIRRSPYSVVLFDEMEKAHPEVLNLLLQIMEEGELRDGQGRVADFRNAVIILTSNVGAELLRRSSLGFSTGRAQSDAYEGMKERLLENLKRRVRPEFLNRLSDVLVFRSLSREDMAKIVDLRISELKERLSSRGLGIKITPAARKVLAKKGYSKEYGARPLRRVIEREIEAPLSEKIIAGEISEGGFVVVRVRKGELRLCKK